MGVPIFAAVAFAVMFGSAFAVGGDSGGGSESGGGSTAGVGTQTQYQLQTQDRQRLQDGTGSGTQLQTQTQNQEELRAREAGQGNATGTVTQEQIQTQAQNAHRVLMQIATSTGGGVGDQIRTIAQEQNQNQEQVRASIGTIQNGSRFAKFLFGPNYFEVRTAQQLLVQNQEQLQQLSQLKNQLTSSGDQESVNQQIQAFTQENERLQNNLNVAQGGFSLLGWLFRMFGA